MSNFIEDLTRVIPQATRLKLVGLLLLTVFGAMLELLGIGLLIPVISFAFSDARVAQIWIPTFLFQSSTPAGFLLYVPLVVCGAVYALKNIYLAWQATLEASILFGIQTTVSNRLMRSLLSRNALEVLDRPPSTMAALFSADIPSVISHSLLPSLTVASELIFLALLTCFLLWQEPLVTALILTAGTAIGSLYLSRTKQLSHALGIKRQILETATLQRVMQTFVGFREILLFQAGEQASTSISGNVTELSETHRRHQLLATLPRFLLETIAAILLLVIIGISMGQGQSPRELIIRLGLFSLSGFRLIIGANRLMMSFQNIRFGHFSLARVARELKSLAQTSEASNPISVQPLQHIEAIEFTDVWFTHQVEQLRYVIRGLSFKVDIGKLVAVVGNSGTGKSTLLDLIAGLRRPTRGEILADGKPISNMTREWRATIGYVSQSPMIFSESIRQNIAFGVAPSAIDDEKIHQAILGANLDKLIASLPEGSHTVIGEGGVPLSGGERQRVAIARALYRDSRVLLLDEPTSALDKDSEAVLLMTLRQLARDRIILVATHRQSTIKYCDKLIELDRIDD